MKYASNNIRNILIAGHAGSGKTTLTEALVYFSGAAERMGRVEDGTTVSDFDPEALCKGRRAGALFQLDCKIQQFLSEHYADCGGADGGIPCLQNHRS